MPAPDAPLSPRVDFGHAFAPPHRLTAGRPDHSDRTLLDLQPGSLRLAWSTDDLTQYPFAIFKTPPVQWALQLTPQVDGQPLARSTWTRLDGYLPALDNRYDHEGRSLHLEVIGGATALLVRVELTNQTTRPATFALRCDSQHWGENPAWVDVGPGDHLLAGWNDRADRVLVLAIGAEPAPPPGPRALLLHWTLQPGQTRLAWLVRPYRAWAADLPELRAGDWAGAFAAARQEWHDLLGRACQPQVPDPEVKRAFLACLADLFIMREPVIGGQVASVPGTEVYRAANVHESAVVAVALDQLGLHEEARRGYQQCLETQEADGNWNDPRGWGHSMWSCAGFKAWAGMQHYHLTGDRAHLEALYPRLVASARWQEAQRARTRQLVDGRRPLTYGLMPRGFGDCGLKDDEDLYGVFLPHNIWAVCADQLALEAAQLLGRDEDLPELQRIWEQGRDDLVGAMEAGAIQETGYRWIPGVPGKTSGSRWGALNALFPCRVLPPDHPLIEGTLRHIEAHLSPGGLPINTGWLAEGMWVAIALDNVAEVHLARGEGDPAAAYLYAVLNHGTPLHTWCEERGQEPGTSQCTGDRQHLWTPVAVVRYLRDALVMEEGEGLHLALGTPRAWLGSGEPVGIAAAPTAFGRVGFQLQYDPAAQAVKGWVRFPAECRAAWAQVHLRLPEGLQARAVDAASGAALAAGGAHLRWDHPRGEYHFAVSTN